MSFGLHVAPGQWQDIEVVFDHPDWLLVARSALSSSQYKGIRPEWAFDSALGLFSVIWRNFVLELDFASNRTGARLSHFCASTFDWSVARAVSPIENVIPRAV